MLKKIISAFLVVSFLLLNFFIFVSSANFNINFEPHCQAILLLNLDTDTVVYEKNIEQKMYPASLTKIMTYIVAVENINDLDGTKITVKKEIIDKLLGTGSSIANIKAGDILSATQLLHCLMVKSGNDAALILADYVGQGNAENFVQMMNAKAKELGCNNTNFLNPHGLHEEEHYTTAKDMAIIAKYALTCPNFSEITNTAVSNILGPEKYPLVTTNSMIDKVRGGQYFYKYARGIKTGHHDQAGYCLVSTAVNNKFSYLCVAMNAPFKDFKTDTNFAMLDSKELYIWAFENLTLKPILKQNEPKGEIKLNLCSEKDKLLLYPAKDFSALLPKEVNPSSVDIVINIPESIDAPIKTGQKIGTAVLKYANKEIATVDLISGEDVNQNFFLYFLKLLKEILSSIWFKIAIFLVLILIVVYIFLVLRYNKKYKAKSRKKLNRMHKRRERD